MDLQILFSPLTLFGLTAVLSMLLFYALEDRSPWFVLAFAGSCVLSSVYGFLIKDGWPFGLVEGVWSIVALRRWQLLFVKARSSATPSWEASQSSPTE